MERKIILNPNYPGPLTIEENFRKVKSHSSIGRMISHYNKRFFVLDLRRMMFYYVPERNSPLGAAYDIPLDTITRIYVDAQLQLLGEGQIWKHGFVILCKKKVLKLIAPSQMVMENFLFAFSQLIDSQTKKPLFDWASYKDGGQQSVEEPNNGSPTSEQFSPISSTTLSGTNEPVKEKKKLKEKEASLPKQEEPRQMHNSGEIKNPTKKNQNPPEMVKKQQKEDEEDQPNQNQLKKNQQKDSVSSKGQKDSLSSKESRDSQGEYGQDLREQQQRKKTPPENYYKRSEVNAMDLATSQTVTREEVISIRRQEEERYVRAKPPSEDDIREEREPPSTIKAKVEVLNLNEKRSEDAFSSKDIAAKRNLGKGSFNNSPSPHENLTSGFWGTTSQKAKTPKEEEYAGFNEVDVSQYQKKEKKNLWNNRENDLEIDSSDNYPNINFGGRNTPKAQAERIEVGKREEKSQWGSIREKEQDYEEEKPRKEAVTQNNKVKKQVDNDDWDDWEPKETKTSKGHQQVPIKSQEPNKNNYVPSSSYQGTQFQASSQLKKETQKSVQKAADEDDWDKEMFGDEDNQYKAKSGTTKKNEVFDEEDRPKKYESASSYKQNDYLSRGKVNNDYLSKKTESTFKENEIPPKRGKIHNDWDDEL